jgi:hypothetical protein
MDAACAVCGVALLGMGLVSAAGLAYDRITGGRLSAGTTEAAISPKRA